MTAPAKDPAAVPQLPSNIEAETALLGAILYDNGAYERIGDHLKPGHFYEPFHQRLFASIETRLRKGQLAELILMAEEFSRDPAYDELGGISYLAALVDHAPPAANARDYADAVYDSAIRREAMAILSDGCVALADPDPETSALEHVEAVEQRLFGLAETGTAAQGFIPAEQYLTAAITLAASAYERDGGLSGLSTGLLDLDRKLGGLHPSDLIICAARPSMGKTSLACNIALDVARRYAFEPQPDGSHKTVAGGKVGFFSLEMSAEQLGMRLLAEVSGVSGDRIRKGEITAQEFGRIRDAALEIQAMPLFVDATGGISLPKLATRARRMKRQGGLDLIVVDYLQLMSSGSKAENRVQEVSAITVGLKALAKDLNVPILALSQLSRQVEQRDNKRPQLSDLRESGSIEQDADMVMFIYRESYYLARTEPKPGGDAHDRWVMEMDEARGVAEIIISKQRHGPIGTVRTSFNEDLTKFGNLARDSHFQASARQPYAVDA